MVDILKRSPAGAWTRRIIAALLACSALPAAAGQGTNGSLHTLGLLSDLETFIHQRGGEASRLDARSMVDLMVDWYRFAATPGASDDVLVYRYGGWSEGCATGFKLSVLRRVEGGADGEAARFAGITLMFEPSGRAELPPYSTTSGDFRSIEAFVAAIEGSPAYRGLEAMTPMSVMMETGGLR